MKDNLNEVVFFVWLNPSYQTHSWTYAAPDLSTNTSSHYFIYFG
jgi:hypothetical protein